MLAAAETVVAANIEYRQADTNIGEGLRLAAQAVRSASDLEPAERSLEQAREAMALRTTRTLTGAYECLAGVLAALRGEHDEAIGHFAAALPPTRSFGDPIWLAELLLDYVDALCADGRSDGGRAARAARGTRAATPAMTPSSACSTTTSRAPGM